MAVLNRLKEIRMRDFMMTQGEFAKFLGFTQQQYNKYENQKEQPNAENMLLISEKLNRTVNDIFYRVPE